MIFEMIKNLWSLVILVVWEGVLKQLSLSFLPLVAP